MTEKVSEPEERANETIRTSLGEIGFRRAGEGTPVLLIHGSPGGTDSSMAMGEFFRRAGYEIIAPARPGYPGTDLETGPFIDEQARLYAALLDELGIEKTYLFAWSGGGPSAYRFAVLFPERVLGIIAFAAVSKNYVPPKTGIDERLIEDTSFGNWLLRFLTKHSPKSTIASTLKAEGDLSRKELKELVQEVVQDEDQSHVVLTMAEVVGDFRNRKAGVDNDMTQFGGIASLQLEKIDAPTLLIHGDADIDVPYEHSVFAKDSIPGSELICMDKGTHLALFAHQDSKEVQKQVLDFLA